MEVEVEFPGKNLAAVGGIRLFHRLAWELSVEEALEHSRERIFI